MFWDFFYQVYLNPKMKVLTRALTRALPGIFLPNQLRVMLWFSKPLMKALTRASPSIFLSNQLRVMQ